MNLMGDYEILDISESPKWNDYLQRIQIKYQDVYFTPEYYHLFENLGDGDAKCFIFKRKNEIAIYPFLINSVNKLGYILDKDYFDIQGVYGYNGILYSSFNPEFIQSFFNALESFCFQQNIIAEFLRIGPLSDSKLHLRNNFSEEFSQKNVIVNLLIDDIWKESYEYSTRKNINKAISHNLEFFRFTGEEIKSDYLEEFKRLYIMTMERNGAENYYFFNNEYFNNLHLYLGKKAIFYFAGFEKKLISCEVVLTNTFNSYSFLGGTDSAYFYLRPNDFLKHYIINDLKNNRGVSFCLGGGTEGIFRFKRSFCKRGVVDFSIGKKIHNASIYNEVVKQWEVKYPEKVESYKNKLLKYRY
jgi:hypothetical protein